MARPIVSGETDCLAEACGRPEPSSDSNIAGPACLGDFFLSTDGRDTCVACVGGCSSSLGFRSSRDEGGLVRLATLDKLTALLRSVMSSDVARECEGLRGPGTSTMRAEWTLEGRLMGETLPDSDTKELELPVMETLDDVMISAFSKATSSASS